MKKLWITIVLLAAVFTNGCGAPGKSEAVSAPPVELKPVHVKIDDATIDKSTPFEIVEPAWNAANIYDSVDEYDRSLASFSKEQRLLVAVSWYIAEVNNGGHAQFYGNSTGIVWPDALEGCKH